MTKFLIYLCCNSCVVLLLRLYGDVDSFFGNSITNLGDVNMDGANDIAIGAPGHDDGKGAVYIFHGNSDPHQGIYEKPSQVFQL